MTAGESFDDVMIRLRAGDQDAAREVFQRFADRLIRLAKRRFDAVMRRKVDPEDVVQSAYKSFFHRYAAGKLEVHDWGKLWSLLVTITVRKCLDRVEYHRAERRDARREAALRPGAEETLPWLEAIARDPTPDQAAILMETVEQLMRECSDRERPILELSLQGFTAGEISLQLGRAERSVRRLREQVRLRFESLQAEA
jgi:RNA polymerase sigma-70 factor (ECF subfamily)